ncbi:PEP/pyruvate-binding domain-containing protein [Nakamurella sp.]|uniref:PEP/pyruvate-binding domain-containing protein n=1 Tax=Nakamurella sp. TaxID=1869182 RepID=UPI0037839929
MTTVASVVFELSDLSSSQLAQVGGKAANLGELLAAGFRVPDGFCVGTAAYRAATDGRLPVPVPVDANAAAVARSAVLAAPMPAPVADAIRERYADLGPDVPVAVRSSATAEDLPGASFAGQQDTYLNVVGIDAVLDAVHRCWASLWTDRAVAYRASQGIDDDVALAVVVQRMVDARAAGVLFTADPITGRRRQAVIDAAPGLGEAVVSGSVDPDHFVVDTATGRILRRTVGGSGTYCLTDGEVRELAELGDRVESAFGSPQDIEWAFDPAGDLWLTQSRPITTLFPVPVRSKPVAAGDVRVFFCVTLAQGLHRPITPMGQAALRVIGGGLPTLAGYPPESITGGPAGFAIAAERVFADFTPALRSRIGRAIAPRGLDVMEARSAVVLRGLFDDPRFSVLPGSRRAGVRTILRAVVAVRAPFGALRAAVRPAAAIRSARRSLTRIERAPVPPPSAPIRERVDAAIDLLSGSFPLAPRILQAAVVGFAGLGLAWRLLRGDVTATDAETVLRGVPHNVTTEMDMSLWDMAVRVRGDRASADLLASTAADELSVRYRAGDLPAVLQREMAAFLARYGQRAVAEIDLGLPRWSDDPAHLFGVLAGYLRLDTGAGATAVAPDRRFADGVRQAEEMVHDLVGRARRRGPLRGVLVSFGLRRARALVGLREMPKFLMITAIARSRGILAGVGAELAAAGALNAADDVFFLDFDEVKAAAAGQDLRVTVAQRRARYEQELGRRHVPRVVLSDGTEPEAVADVATTGEPGTLVGSPASAGTVTGVARVILDPVGARLEPGEILVAPSTDPGWTPLFLTAGGLVMEMGGSNSHGAVVAREYGIPAVVGVAGATRDIRSGMQITVDGAAGVVRMAGE